MPAPIRIPQLELTGIEEQLDVNPLEVEVVNTTTVTNVYVATIPAGALGTNRLLEVGMIGDYLNGFIGPERITLRIRFGGVTAYESTSPIEIGASGTRRGVVFKYTFTNRDVATVQLGGGYFIVGSEVGATTGIGGLAALEAADRTGSEYVSTPGAIDTSLSRTIELAIGLQTASVNISFRKQLAYIKVVRVG